MNSIATGYAVFYLRKTFEIVDSYIINCSFAQLFIPQLTKKYNEIFY